MGSRSWCIRDHKGRTDPAGRTRKSTRRATWRKQVRRQSPKSASCISNLLHRRAQRLHQHAFAATASSTAFALARIVVGADLACAALERILQVDRPLMFGEQVGERFIRQFLKGLHAVARIKIERQPRGRIEGHAFPDRTPGRRLLALCHTLNLAKQRFTRHDAEARPTPHHMPPCCIAARPSASRPGAVISTAWPSRIAILAAAALASKAASLLAYGPL